MPAPTSITDLSTTASSNYPAGTDLPSALDDAVRALASVVKYNVSKGTDIASASSITIPAQGSYFVVTGTTTITTIADTNAFAGREVTLKFSGALTLTHSAGLILPGAANITTAAGDVAKVVFESTGVWRCTTFTSGQALTDADIGVSVQAYDALLASLAGQTVAANKIQAYSASDTASLLDFKDEDDMASNSATAVPSQQSVKAYVDANIGKIKQVVFAHKTDTFSTASTTFTDVTGLSVSITPTSASNKVLVLASICNGKSSGVGYSYFDALRDSTVIVEADAAGSRITSTASQRHDEAASLYTTAIMCVDSPGDTSVHTYKIQMAVTSGTTGYVNRSGTDTDGTTYPRSTSSIIALEYEP